MFTKKRISWIITSTSLYHLHYTLYDKVVAKSAGVMASPAVSLQNRGPETTHKQHRVSTEHPIGASDSKVSETVSFFMFLGFVGF